MAKVFGTIESLKALKAELQNREITRFNSVKEINVFLSNYNSEKLKIINEASKQLEKDYLETCTHLKERLLYKSKTINLESEKIDSQIHHLKQKTILFDSKKNNNFFSYIIYGSKLFLAKKRLSNLITNKPNLIDSSLNAISNEIKNEEAFIDAYKTDKQSLVNKRAKPEIENLEYTRKVLENSKNLISGAIGENLVEKEIKKLSDDFVLINDFNLSFSSPLFYRKKNQYIRSVQIDHLLISKSGIFIIETKNWSKSSVNSISLRSPVEQIERFNFALYIYISNHISLKDHHWGEKSIPLRNLIVMINNKPVNKFKFVSIKSLSELNGYINYFEPVFTTSELNEIVYKLTN